MEKELGDVPAGSVVTTNCSTESTPVFVEVRERGREEEETDR